MMNDEARALCVHALSLNVENKEDFHTFVEDMEKVADLLKLKINSL
jgi:hypothetical protein